MNLLLSLLPRALRPCSRHQPTTQNCSKRLWRGNALPEGTAAWNIWPSSDWRWLKAPWVAPCSVHGKKYKKVAGVAGVAGVGHGAWRPKSACRCECAVWWRSQPLHAAAMSATHRCSIGWYGRHSRTPHSTWRRRSKVSHKRLQLEQWLEFLVLTQFTRKKISSISCVS